MGKQIKTKFLPYEIRQNTHIYSVKSFYDLNENNLSIRLVLQL